MRRPALACPPLPIALRQDVASERASGTQQGVEPEGAVVVGGGGDVPLHSASSRNSNVGGDKRRDQ